MNSILNNVYILDRLNRVFVIDFYILPMVMSRIMWWTPNLSQVLGSDVIVAPRGVWSHGTVVIMWIDFIVLSRSTRVR